MSKEEKDIILLFCLLTLNKKFLYTYCNIILCLNKEKSIFALIYT